LTPIKRHDASKDVTRRRRVSSEPFLADKGTDPDENKDRPVSMHANALGNDAAARHTQLADGKCRGHGSLILHEQA
jgi:hypothetical protein